MAVLSENNLTISDIKATLGSSSNDVGTLCTSSAINMYSMKKPVYRENNTASEWYKAYNGNYSITIPAYSYGQTPVDWSYIKPSGGGTSPYSMGHFKGYNHLAVAPLIQPQSSFSFNLWSSSYITIPLMLSVESNDVINASDLSYSGSKIEDMYFGAEVSKSGETTVKLTAFDTIKMGDFLVLDFNQPPFKNWSTGTATIKFFLSSEYKGPLDSEPLGNKKCNIPSSFGSHSSAIITITNQSLLQETANKIGTTKTGIFVDGEDSFTTPLVSTNKAAWKLTLKNNGTSTYTLYDHDLDWKVMPDMQGFDKTIDCNGKMFNTSGTTLNSVTIAAGVSSTIVLYSDYVLGASGPDDFVNTTFELQHKGSRIAAMFASYEASPGAGGGGMEQL